MDLAKMLSSKSGYSLYQTTNIIFETIMMRIIKANVKKVIKRTTICNLSDMYKE